MKVKKMMRKSPRKSYRKMSMLSIQSRLKNVAQKVKKVIKDELNDI
jgi:hypothetical protein